MFANGNCSILDRKFSKRNDSKFMVYGNPMYSLDFSCTDFSKGYRAKYICSCCLTTIRELSKKLGELQFLYK